MKLVLRSEIHTAIQLGRNPMSSTKLEVHNLLQRRRRRTEPRPQATCTKNLAKITRVVPLTDRQTHTHKQTYSSQYFAIAPAGEVTTLCLKKNGSTFKMSLTLSNLNRFLKFLHCWKAYEICYKSHMTVPNLPQACCYTTLRN